MGSWGQSYVAKRFEEKKLQISGISGLAGGFRLILLFLDEEGTHLVSEDRSSHHELGGKNPSTASKQPAPQL